jgi:small subunit ribosomal protein S20
VATHASAKKRARQADRREARNRPLRSSVKSAVRAFREALASGDKNKAKEQLAEAARVIRKAASKGAMPKQTASRRVSRMAQAFNKAGQQAQA